MSSPGFGEVLRIDPVTVTVSALSCGVFFMLVVLLLLLIYRRSPFCCITGSSRQHINAHPHYHSRDALIGCVIHDEGVVNHDVMVQHQTPGGPFVIGKPSDYHLPGPLPRLPSYESVRRKDRRTHIHHMITQRFGLNASPHRDWEEGYMPPPPPSYEESLHQPLEVPSLGSLRRLDDEVFPAHDQDGQSSQVDHRTVDNGQPGPSHLPNPHGGV